MTGQRTFGCRYMLFDMSNRELIDTLKKEGWRVEIYQPDPDTGDASWSDARDDYQYEFEEQWLFRVSKGDQSSVRGTDLYPLANRAIYGGD